jgi:hypothetical protein
MDMAGNVSEWAAGKLEGPLSYIAMTKGGNFASRTAFCQPAAPVNHKGTAQNHVYPEKPKDYWAERGYSY